MIISDLNYLEAVSQAQDVVGGFWRPPSTGGTTVTLNKNLRSVVNTNLSFSSNTLITENLVKNSSVTATSNVSGNLASIAFDNEALGNDSTTQTTLSQVTIQGTGSSQGGTIISSTNP